MTERELKPLVTGTEVVDGLVDVLGTSNNILKKGGLANFLVYEAGQGRLHRIIVDGEPGTGKSTCVFQIQKKFDVQGIPTQRVQHDDLLVRAATIIGKPYPEWNDDDREIFSEIVFDALMSRPEGHVQLVEAVTVGQKERGQKALSKLSEDDFEREHTQVIALIPNLELQDRSARLRSRILDRTNKVEDEDVEHILQEEFGVRIDGWRDTLRDRNRTKGKLIKRTIEKMAPAMIIESIREEVFRQANKKNAIDPKESSLFRLVEKAPPAVQAKFVRDLAYLWELQAEIQLNMSFVYNPTREDMITLYADMFEKDS
jgi:hypothetical protein